MIIRFLATTALAAACIPAQAADYSDTAEVISTVPIHGAFNEPQQRCWTETVNTLQQAPRSYGGTVLGGVAGGLIGSTIGDGNGQIAAAAAGAAIGALVGNRADERNARSTVMPQQVQRCTTIQSARQGITGYQVTYNYNGRNATVVLPFDPGPQVRVDISAGGAPAQAVQSASQAQPPRELSPGMTYVNERGEVPIWAYKPYKRPRPAPAPDETHAVN